MNEEELDEIERTLKISKPYNELRTYNYFNCESIEKLLIEKQQLKENWIELKRILKEMYIHTQYTGYLDIISKMEGLERL